MPTQAPDRRRWPLMLLGVLLLLALVALLIWLSRPEPVWLQGQIEVDSVRVSAKIGGRVADILVEEGDRVEPGQLLVVLATPEAEARERQVEAQIAAARAMADLAREGARTEQIEAARAQWQAASAQAELAAETLARIDSLHADGVVPTQRRDEVRAAAVAAQAQANAARQAYDIARSAVRPQELEAARAQLAQAEGGLAEVQAALDEARQLAPAAGEISVRVVEVGEVVGPGFPLLVIARTDRPWLTLQLREDLMPGMRIGRRLEGRVPALGLEGVAFEIHYIAPLADFATWRSSRDMGAFDLRTFELRARPVAEVPGLRPGMSVLIDERTLRDAP